VVEAEPVVGAVDDVAVGVARDRALVEVDEADVCSRSGGGPPLEQNAADVDPLL